MNPPPNRHQYRGRHPIPNPASNPLTIPPHTPWMYPYQARQQPNGATVMGAIRRTEPSTLSTDSTAIDFADKIVKLCIGPNGNVILSVHANVLTQSSLYFKNEMRPEWSSQRADPLTIFLPDEDPAIVKAYVQWLYSRNIPILNAEANNSESCFQRLAEVYIFGERRMDMQFRNAVITHMISATSQFGCYPSLDIMDTVYHGTISELPMRRLLADFIAYSAKVDDVDWDEVAEWYSEEMVGDRMRALTRMRTPLGDSSLPWLLPGAQYFEGNGWGTS